MTTFIFGHRNPDTDSVCSSIALSYLKNAKGDKTLPKILGNVNNETKFVLDYFHIPIPSYLNDVKVRIKNIKYSKKTYIYEYESIDEAYKKMQRENTTAIPLVDEKKKLTGYITLKELAKFLVNGNKEVVDTSLSNIIENLNAEVINQHDEYIKGNILIAGLKSKTIASKIDLGESDILIVGNRHRVLDYAISSKVKLIILPLNSEIEDKLLKKAIKNGVNIIATGYDSFQIATKIMLSNYVKNININRNPVTVNVDDYYADFKTMTHKVNHTNYPVINNKGECLGLIRLTGPNAYEKQKVILVDHNNMAQSVEGIEEANILEIIDHHNLGEMGTSVPINFRSKPVGCTSTMIYDMYKEANVKIPKDIAGIMLSAILSDTLLLTGPTTTEEDRSAALKLASIAKVDIKKFGLEMLKAASSIKGMSVDELIKEDLKTYFIGKTTLGIAQIMTLDFETIKENIDEFVTKLNEMVNTNYSMVVLFVTDIIKKGSYVIYNDDAKDYIAEAFGLKAITEGLFIPKIVSRKKQMLPCIMNCLEE